MVTYMEAEAGEHEGRFDVGMTVANDDQIVQRVPKSRRITAGANNTNEGRP